MRCKSARARSGFSFLEVLVALLILVIMISFMGRALLISMKAENRARILRQASLQGSRVATQRFADYASPDRDGWTVSEQKPDTSWQITEIEYRLGSDTYDLQLAWPFEKEE
jgi:prepilin-type N-terminal cleavage/methylation domain-containing protein